MTELLDHLSPALSDRYRIERELGAGGMAAVLSRDRLPALPSRRHQGPATRARCGPESPPEIVTNDIDDAPVDWGELEAAQSTVDLAAPPDPLSGLSFDPETEVPADTRHHGQVDPEHGKVLEKRRVAQWSRVMRVKPHLGGEVHHP